MSKRPWLVFVLFAVFVLMVGAACSASAGDTRHPRAPSLPTSEPKPTSELPKPALPTKEAAPAGPHLSKWIRRCTNIRRELFLSTRRLAGQRKKPSRMC